MQYEHIETIQGDAVIGQKYLVRCIPRIVQANSIDLDESETAIWEGEGGATHILHNSTEFWPVQAQAHEDKELLGVDWYHYHYDLRFLTDEQIRRLASSAETGYSSQERIFILGASKKMHPQTRYVPLILRRQMPDYPQKYYYGNTELLEKGLPQDVRVNTKAKCMRCPHRNTPLNGLPVKNGIVTCPAHGLSWDINNGDMVKEYILDPVGVVKNFKKEISL